MIAFVLQSFNALFMNARNIFKVYLQTEANFTDVLIL